MTKPEPRIQDALVIRVKGVRSGEVFRMIIDEFLAKAATWSGNAMCIPVFQLSMIRPGEYHDTVWPGVFIPNDTAGIEELLLGMDELDSVQHRRAFQPNAKTTPKPKKVKQKKEEGPFSAKGFDLSEYRPALHPFFDNVTLHAESDLMQQLMKGYPFQNMTPVQNFRWIEMEIIGRMRDRFPTIYDLDRVLGGIIKECLVLISKPEVQKHGTPSDFSLWNCFCSAQPPNVVISHHARLKGLDWVIRTGRLKEFRNRKVVDPTDDEAAEDKLFHIVGTGRGVQSDRSWTDDEIDEEEFLAATESSLDAITEGEAEAMSSGTGALTNFG